MVLKQIKQKIKPVEEVEDEEEIEDPDNSDLDEEEEQIKKQIRNLPSVKKAQEKKPTLRIVNKEQIPYQRLETVTGEDGETYEVISIEEALTEILSILRESA